VLARLHASLLVHQVEQGGVTFEAVRNLQEREAQCGPGMRRDLGRLSRELEQEAFAVKCRPQPLSVSTPITTPTLRNAAYPILSMFSDVMAARAG
jgi:hypothetical protein